MEANLVSITVLAANEILKIVDLVPGERTPRYLIEQVHKQSGSGRPVTKQLDFRFGGHKVIQRQHSAGHTTTACEAALLTDPGRALLYTKPSHA